MTSIDAVKFDSGRFRHVLGHFATGVAVITAVGPDGPAGMVVSSFTSVSLEPPLVAFLPDKNSTSWPQIAAAGAFCVNILSVGQEELCARFARKGIDKFAGVDWRAASSGSPILEGVMAWIDCDLTQTFESGDHYIAIGRVLELEANESGAPLVFFQGGYGDFMQRLARQQAGQSEQVDPEESDIVLRAAGLLAERGIANSSLDEIAEATGMTLDELQGHWMSKEGIVDELVGKYVRTFSAECAAIVARNEGAEATIEELLKASFESMEANRAAVLILQNEREYLAKQPEFGYLEPLERQIKKHWVTSLADGVEHGAFRADLDVNLTYRYIRDNLFMAARWYTDGRRERAQLAGAYGTMILRGILI